MLLPDFWANGDCRQPGQRSRRPGLGSAWVGYAGGLAFRRLTRHNAANAMSRWVRCMLYRAVHFKFDPRTPWRKGCGRALCPARRRRALPAVWSACPARGLFQSAACTPRCAATRSCMRCAGWLRSSETRRRSTERRRRPGVRLHAVEERQCRQPPGLLPTVGMPIVDKTARHWRVGSRGPLVDHSAAAVRQTPSPPKERTLSNTRYDEIDADAFFLPAQGLYADWEAAAGCVRLPDEFARRLVLHADQDPRRLETRDCRPPGSGVGVAVPQFGTGRRAVEPGRAHRAVSQHLCRRGHRLPG